MGLRLRVTGSGSQINGRQTVHGLLKRDSRKDTDADMTGQGHHQPLGSILDCLQY